VAHFEVRILQHRPCLLLLLPQHKNSFMICFRVSICGINLTIGLAGRIYCYELIIQHIGRYIFVGHYCNQSSQRWFKIYISQHEFRFDGFNSDLRISASNVNVGLNHQIESDHIHRSLRGKECFRDLQISHFGTAI
jgi:hypothetical protein